MNTFDPKNTGSIVLYEDFSHHRAIKVQMSGEDVWLSLDQIASLFDADKSGVSRHLKNIFKTAELSQKQVVAKIATTATDGRTYQVAYYNLDAIIAVGYRVNSKQATHFRIWATKILREYVLRGYIFNQKRLHEKGLDEFEKSIRLIKGAMASRPLTEDEKTGLLEVITGYSESWALFQKYDEGRLDPPKKSRKASYVITYEEARLAIQALKDDLIPKGDAGPLFGNERSEMLQSVLGNIYQTFGGKELYPTLEDKAAHLLYFIIKDHPFSDGNKRSAALLFLLFLRRNQYHLDVSGQPKINPAALVALALLVAESKPSEKEVMVHLIMNLIHFK